MASDNIRKVRRKERIRWTQESEKFLLYLWKAEFSELRNSQRKFPIYVDMAKKMAMRGYPIKAMEIKYKTHNLTNRYKAEKIRLRNNGLTESDWSLYKPLDNLLGNNVTYEWEPLVDDYKDPLNETQDGELPSDDDEDEDGEIHAEGHSFKMEYEVEPCDMVEVDSTHSNSNILSTKKEVDQSEVEDVCKTKESETKKSGGQNSRFRIIADRNAASKHNMNANKVTSQTSKASRFTDIPARLSNQLAAQKANTHTLNLARWEVIQLQKDNALKEMEYRKLEFEQKTEEHKLRLKYMEEEHHLRMQSLRNQSTVSGNEDDCNKYLEDKTF